MNHDACIKKSIEYIEDNLDNKIELKELADKAFLSKYHFHRVFHSVVGEPVAEYIRKRRLKEAASELVTTDNKIVDIALKYQFSSQEAFTKAFKRIYGVPPREFRTSKVMVFDRRSSNVTKLSMAA
ncbi:MULTISPECIES: helix-turn-helix transcriptional regulator [Clostridium]|uniref:Transcriptional regulator, AraC family n=1 Tax=Clostridium intestinale DSM 6191 TaxID=1121320 RepID=A0A1M5Y5G6_9CLOT|nr:MULTISPECIES: helix-turn-helix transcriptional regulator [Clostridium]SHI07331.1 transcriptional regulator, AraC family [Clostridium intestinale DSM 6191]